MSERSPEPKHVLNWVVEALNAQMLKCQILYRTTQRDMDRYLPERNWEPKPKLTETDRINWPGMHFYRRTGVHPTVLRDVTAAASDSEAHVEVED